MSAFANQPLNPTWPGPPLNAAMDQATLNRYAGGVRALFLETFENEPNPMVMRIALEVTEARHEMSYPWMGQVPQMEEWAGQRIIQQLKMNGFTIKNKRWQEAIGIPWVDFELDTLGLHSARIADLAKAARRHPLLLLASLATNGSAATSLSYDGQPFYTSTHPADGASGIQSNRISGHLTAAIFANGMQYGTTTQGQILDMLRQDYVLAQQALMRMKGDKGTYLRNRGDLITCSTELEPYFKLLFGASDIGATTNIFKGECDILALPEMDDYTHPLTWALHCTKRSIKPFIWQTAIPISFTPVVDKASFPVFMQDQAVFGADSYDNGGYGMWQLSVQVYNEA